MSSRKNISNSKIINGNYLHLLFLRFPQFSNHRIYTCAFQLEFYILFNSTNFSKSFIIYIYNDNFYVIYQQLLLSVTNKLDRFQNRPKSCFKCITRCYHLGTFFHDRLSILLKLKTSWSKQQC